MHIDKEYLNEIKGELFGFNEIGFFEDYQYKKGLHATKEGVSSYSSKKYKKRYFREIWTLIKNWTTVITLISTSLIFLRYCQPSQEPDGKESEQSDYIKDSEKTLQKTKSNQNTELKDVDSIKNTTSI